MASRSRGAPAAKRSVAPCHVTSPTPSRPTVKRSTAPRAASPHTRTASRSASAEGRCERSGGGGKREGCQRLEVREWEGAKRGAGG